MNTQIYVMTHKKIAEIQNDIYIPLHVGKEGKQDLGYLGDNTGDNISAKNSSYCELTGLYWLWKNIECDIIGICHYRRYFTRNEILLDKSYIEETIRKHPIIVPNSGCVRESCIYDQYKKIHDSTKDLDICREVIAEKCPEYLAAFDYHMKTVLISVGNMWITKKDIFDRYCTWLFDILFEAEKRIDTTGYDDYQKRVMGFLSERLFRIWLFMQRESVTEENVKLIDSADFTNAEKKVGLLFQYVKLKIDPAVQMFKLEETEHMPEDQFVCQDDFEGRIPVWVCWWQGEEHMPDIIRLCVKSLKKNLPEKKVTMRLITLENCLEYAAFTETIIQKYNEGKISDDQLKNILCAELLYRYGGMWIDASYFAASPVPESIFEGSGIYTLRFPQPVWSADITQGRWSGNLWFTAKKKKLFRMLMECLRFYWELEDDAVDYFLLDYIIAVLLENFSDVREELGQCTFASTRVFELQRLINKKYTEERVEYINKESVFYKMNCHLEYRKVNIAGELTVYGYLCNIC